MPIRGVTDSSSGSGLPQLGTLKKGAPKEQGLKDLNHYRLDIDPKFSHYQGKWEELYGTEPQKLAPLLLLGREQDQIFDAWKEEWGQSGLVCRCDGESIKREWANGSY